MTDTDENNNITGVVLRESYTENDKYYTRLEYHHFAAEQEDGKTVYPYYIENTAYVSKDSEFYWRSYLDGRNEMGEASSN